MESGIAADYLGLSIEDLGAQLVELRARRLIGPSPPNGLQILDITGSSKRRLCAFYEFPDPRLIFPVRVAKIPCYCA